MSQLGVSPRLYEAWLGENRNIDVLSWTECPNCERFRMSLLEAGKPLHDNDGKSLCARGCSNCLNGRVPEETRPRRTNVEGGGV